MTQDILIEEKTTPQPYIPTYKNDYFGDSIIGQQNLKNKIGFYLDSHKKTKIFPNSLFYSKRGEGKTSIARIIGKSLLGSDLKPKPFIEINGASIKNLNDFITQIIQPFVIDKESTVFIDEINNVNKHTLEWLLSVLAPNENNRTTAFYQGAQYDFPFDKFSFLAATTNKEDLSLALKNRLYQFEFEPYKHNELKYILHKNTKDIEFQDGTDDEIIKTVRESPRTTVMAANDIKQYAAQKNKYVFNIDDWLNFRKILNILPRGLSVSETNLLRYLNDNGPATLTCLSAYFNLDAKSIRRETESYLLSHGLIKIEGKRMITLNGQRLLKEIDDLG